MVSSDVEIGMAIIRDSGDDPSEVGRFSFMPQLGVRPYDRVEYVYYHQSNAGIYENNASLNMQQLALFSTF